MTIDEIREIYLEFSKTYEADVKRNMNYTAYHRVPRLVMKYLNNRNPRILDLGCGTGLSSLLFFKHGFTVTGIDGSKEMIARASKLPYKKLLYQNLETSLRVKDGVFDAAIMVGVVDYLNDPSVVLREVRKKLVERGVFGFTVPQKSPWYAEYGLSSYYRREIEPIIEESGFTILEQERIVGVEDDGQRAYYRNYIARKAQNPIRDAVAKRR